MDPEALSATGLLFRWARLEEVLDRAFAFSADEEDERGGCSSMPSELRSIDPEAGVLAGCFLLGIAFGFAGFTPLLLLATSPSLPFSVVALLGVAGVARRACEAPLPVLPAGFFVKKPNSVDCLPVFCDAGALLPFDLLMAAPYD